MENIGTFFYFIYVIHKNNCWVDKIEKKMKLQSINYENCGCYSFYISINYNHTSHVINKILKINNKFTILPFYFWYF